MVSIRVFLMSFMVVLLSVPVASAVDTDWCYAYVERAQYDKAIETCTEDINSGKWSGNDLATNHNNRGRAYHANGYYGKAIADFNKAIDLSPKDYHAYNNRGNAYRAIGDYDKAIADFNKAIELNPKDYHAYNNRGLAYNAKGDYGRATLDYSKAIELNPKYSKAYNNRGNVYEAKGDYDRAIADFNKAIELKTKYDYAYLNLINASMKKAGDGYKAELVKLKAHVTNNPSDEWIRTISKYYMGMEGVTESFVLKEAAKGKTVQNINERLCEAYYYLGEMRLFKGDRKGAKAFFQRSIYTDIENFVEYWKSRANLKLMAEGKL